MSTNRSHRQFTCLRLLAALTLAAVGLFAVAPRTEAAPAGRVAWVGSPIDGTVTSPPPHSHPYGENWSVDIARGSSQAVGVYVAVDKARDPRVSTRILHVD